MKIKRTIVKFLDEREERLVTKAGMEAFSFLMLVVWPYMLDRWLWKCGFHSLSTISWVLDCDCRSIFFVSSLVSGS